MKLKSWIPSIIPVVFCTYFLMALHENGKARELHYMQIEASVVANFKKISKAHAEFADLYKSCEVEFTAVINDTCVNLAVTSMANTDDKKSIIKAFYELNIPEYGMNGEAWDLLFSPMKVLSIRR